MWLAWPAGVQAHLATVPRWDELACSCLLALSTSLGTLVPRTPSPHDAVLWLVHRSEVELVVPMWRVCALRACMCVPVRARWVLYMSAAFLVERDFVRYLESSLCYI